MFKRYHLLFLCLFIGARLFGETVHTFYGELEVEEPVIIEAILPSAVML